MTGTLGVASADGFGVLPVTTLAALAVEASLGIIREAAALAASMTAQSTDLLAAAAASSFFSHFNHFFSSFFNFFNSFSRLRMSFSLSVNAGVIDVWTASGAGAGASEGTAFTASGFTLLFAGGGRATAGTHSTHALLLKLHSTMTQIRNYHADRCNHSRRAQW